MNVSHANAMSQGGFNGGYNATGYYRPRHSTTSGTKTTRLHELSNALQSAHAGKINNATVAHSGKHQSNGLNSSAQTAGTAAASTKSHQTPVSTDSTTPAGAATASSAAGSGQKAMASRLSLSNSGASVPSGIKSRFSLASTESSGSSTTAAGQSPIKSAVSLSNTGTSTAPLSTTGSTTSPGATYTNGASVRMTPAYLSLMSELYGPYGLPHYSPYGSGYGYGRNRYYGSRYYGTRNNYGNRNNSMYFAQMRRLSRLASDLNMLNRGTGAGAGAGAGTGANTGLNSNMTSRIRGDLMGVVFSNRRTAVSGGPPACR